MPPCLGPEPQTLDHEPGTTKPKLNLRPVGASTFCPASKHPQKNLPAPALQKRQGQKLKALNPRLNFTLVTLNHPNPNSKSVPPQSSSLSALTFPCPQGAVARHPGQIRNDGSDVSLLLLRVLDWKFPKFHVRHLLRIRTV